MDAVLFRPCTDAACSSHFGAQQQNYVFNFQCARQVEFQKPVVRLSVNISDANRIIPRPKTSATTRAMTLTLTAPDRAILDQIRGKVQLAIALTRGNVNYGDLLLCDAARL